MFKKILFFGIILSIPKIQSMDYQAPPLAELRELRELRELSAPTITISSTRPIRQTGTTAISDTEFGNLIDSIAGAKVSSDQFRSVKSMYAFLRTPIRTMVSCSKDYTDDRINCFVIVNNIDKNWSFSEGQSKLLWTILDRLYILKAAGIPLHAQTTTETSTISDSEFNNLP